MSAERSKSDMDGKRFRVMGSAEGALVAAKAVQKLRAFDDRGIFVDQTLAAIRDANYKRKKEGFITHPSSSIEVGGLIRAALGEHAHMRGVRPVGLALIDYTVGLLQSDVLSIEQAAQHFVEENKEA